ncbi:hypothetical protein XENORESO_001750, partial [Xenotaenia resolanae]
KMFIGGLSWQTTQEGLREYFCKFGEVKECMVMRDPVTKRSRGFGFVTYADQDGVEKVLAQNRHELDSKTGANMKAFFLGLHCHGYLGDLNGVVGAPANTHTGFMLSTELTEVVSAEF